MRFAPIAHLMGWTLTVVSIPMLVIGLTSFIFEENASEFFIRTFLIPVFLGLMTGLFMIQKSRKGFDQDEGVRDREAVTAVGLGWLIVIFFGGIPYWLGGTFHGPFGYISGDSTLLEISLGLLHSWFESMSGFTTTGATVIDPLTSPICNQVSDCIGSQPKSLLLWRSTTQWLGGMGVIMLSILILGRWIGGGLTLAREELTGPSLSRLGPKLQQTAAFLWGVYALLTIVEFALLYFIGKIGMFDSINHALTTMSSGGFSTHDAGIMYFDSFLVESIIVCFMVLTGLNFSLFHIAYNTGLKNAFKDQELRIYLSVLFLAWLAMTFSLTTAGGQGFFDAARSSLFQAASIGTSTGYASADFAVWPVLSLLTLLFLMIVGASAGSTSGGLKIMRLKIAYEIVRQEIRRIVQPRQVRSIRMNGEVVDETKVQVVLGMLSAWAVAAVIGTTLIAIIEYDLDLTSVLSVVISCLGNSGPALGVFGPTATWASMHPLSMFGSTIMMWIGRLEILTVLVIFNPRAWRL